MERGKKYIAVLLSICFLMGCSLQTFAAESRWLLKNGNWMYVMENGSYKTNAWFQDKDQQWYHFDESGYMQTGWQLDGGKWYYLNGTGAMKTGWLQDKGNWYYLADSGAMKTGWAQDKGAWYYLDGSGAMKTGWAQLNNAWYYLNSSGAMETGWFKDKEVWYYLDTSGAMLVNATRTINGVSYTFGSTGAWTGDMGSANSSQNSSSFQTGSWSDKTFTNSWSNIKVTVPAAAKIYTAQEMRATVGTGQNILVNDGTVTQEKVNAYSDTVIYDFIVQLGDQSSDIRLSYANISSMASSVTAEQFAVSLSEQLTANSILSYTIEGTERVTLGGNEFIKLKATVLSRVFNQDIYVRKLDNYMIMLTITYLPDNVSYVNTALSGLTSAR